MNEDKTTLSRRGILVRSAVLLAAATTAGGLLELPAEPAHAEKGTIDHFAWCNQCQVLHRRYDADLPYQLCAAGGNHSYPYPTSGLYWLYCNNTHPPVPQQTGWDRCTRCNTVFYVGGQNNSRCVGGSPHLPAGTDRFNLLQAPYNNETQDGWRWCRKCMALFFFGSGSYGACTLFSSATSWGHDPTGSGTYFVSNLGNEGWIGAQH